MFNFKKYYKFKKYKFKKYKLHIDDNVEIASVKL